MNERATGSAQAAALELTVTPSFLSCSSHTCPRRGASAGPRRWDSTSFLFTASPPVGLTVRPATSWRTATVEWSTCQVSGRGGQLQDGRTACDLLCIPRPDRKLFTHSGQHPGVQKQSDVWRIFLSMLNMFANHLLLFPPGV